VSDLAVWQDGAWRHLDVPFFFNDVAGLKRRMAIGAGAGRIIVDAAPPLTTTTAPPPPPPDLMFPAKGGPPVAAPGMPVPVPTTVPVGPWAVGPGGVPGGNGPVDIVLPDGIGADGVIFIRVVVDPTNFSPDAIFNLVEVVQ
jgi:hypothetical protein